MSENQNKATRAFKKRYIAVAALSALAIAGGTIGATITAQSTIKDNQITVTENQDAIVSATGSPISMTWSQGEQTVDAKTTVVLTNSGKTAATVGLAEIGVLLPVADSDAQMWINVKDGSNTFFRQRIDENNPILSKNNTITLDKGQSKSIVVTVQALFTRGIAQADKAFDLQFTYKTSGSDAAAVSTPQTTIADNRITVTAPQAKVTATGAPMDVVWDTANTPATEATYTLKNDGGAAATVKLLPIEGVEVDAGPSTQVYLRGYLNGAGNPIFAQDVQKGASAPRPSQEFTLEPGATATVKMLFGKQGPGAPAVYEKTFDLKFDFVTKK